MNNLEKYQNAFISVFGVEEESLDETFTFKDVAEWNSLSHMMLISELEETFDLLFDSEDILHFGGYENGMKILEKYGISFDE